MTPARLAIAPCFARLEGKKEGSMWEFNIVATMANEGRFRHLMQELDPYGEFRKTEFLGVVLGRVEDKDAFLEAVREKTARQLIAFQDLGRVVPVDQVFIFRVEDFLDKMRESIRPYIERLANKCFYVRLERRGHKGQIISPEAERAMDAFIREELSKEGKSAQIDFENPDAVIVVETIGDRCGVGLLTRELMDRYEFVRVG
jgi:tRNA(Ser,Leu) C12 N-acetylase TAN1